RSVGSIYADRNKRCGIHLTVHVGRHLGAWILLEDGFDLEQVSRVLGHASPETTRQYYAELNRMRDLRLYQDALARQFRARGKLSARAAWPSTPSNASAEAGRRTRRHAGAPPSIR